VKNFYSLREVLIKAEKIINPLISLNDEITSNIRKLDVCSQDVLLTLIPNLTKKLLNEWAHRYATEQKIIVVPDTDGSTEYVSADTFFKKYSQLIKLIIDEPAKFDGMSKNEKEQKSVQADLFSAALSDLFFSGKIAQIFGTPQQNELKSLHDAYETYSQLKPEKITSVFKSDRKKSKNILMRIVEPILNLFRSRGKTKKAGKEFGDNNSSGMSYRKNKTRTQPTKYTMQLIALINEKSSPLIALSDIIDFVPENDDAIKTLIETLDSLQEKVVIPIYNSDKVLYPKRSLEVLMPNTEYLVVDASHIATSESIQEFIHSIRGMRLKNEPIPMNAIFSIEKYLMGISRKKRTLRRV